MKRRKRGVHASTLISYWKDFFRTLSIEEHWWRCRKIPRCALVPLILSPWRQLLSSGNKQANITMLGFDCKSFDTIFEKFDPMFVKYTPFTESGTIEEVYYVLGG